MSAFLDLYESLDIIGNGSFGIIRKVRRKADGMVFARKELNFERMSERDRKQIVAEVNILKDLHHDHIVRYHDRHVDRDAGILYIIMEYCGGGDLSTVIHQAQKHNRPIPEDTIWGYFFQILQALQHCHHPNGHARSGSSGSGSGIDADGKERRAQILHRDLKPDNVFLDTSNTVKLGDFGLSKALAQASFANTYVGTPYYMSPELMQEKAYDSKSDIWSLGCLIYELCALKPPFHEAKTHAELSIFIRNGRIPPLPRGYSQSLSGVIKAMLNLNPAMRPSAAQLLAHERLELVAKIADTEKMLSTVKSHKSNVLAKERELHAREALFSQKESQLHALLSQKDSEVTSLQQSLATAEASYTVLQGEYQHLKEQVDAVVREAIGKRENELRVQVMKREEEVSAAMMRREEEIMEAVRMREAELGEAWRVREEEVRGEVEERVQWVLKREEEIKVEAGRLEAAREELQKRVKGLGDERKGGRKQTTPLEEVKNLLAPLAQTPAPAPPPTPRPYQRPSPLETPVNRRTPDAFSFEPSAMKGVVLTLTGEPLATPTPAELAKLFVNTPKVGLDFAKIFDDDDDEDDEEEKEVICVVHDDSGDDTDGEGPLASPCVRRISEVAFPTAPPLPAVPSTTQEQQPSSSTKPSRLRRPSAILSRPQAATSVSLPPSLSDPTGLLGPSASTSQPTTEPQAHSNSAPAPVKSATSTSTTASKAKLKASATLPPFNPAPEYDLEDEENLPSPFLKRTSRKRSTNKLAPPPVEDLPSPFLKRVERTATGGGPSSSALRTKRPSNGSNLLRAMAAANSASTRAGKSSVSTSSVTTKASGGRGSSRPSIASARKAGEEARKVLLK